AVPASIFADLASGKPPAAPSVLIAVELGDNAAVVEKLATEAATKTEGLRVETTNYAGVLVHTNTSAAAKPGSPAPVPAVTAVRPAWASAKWFSVAADKFDLRAAYTALEEMLANISPQLSTAMQAEIKNAGAEMGLDLKRDLVGSLGSDLLVAQALPPGADPA